MNPGDPMRRVASFLALSLLLSSLCLPALAGPRPTLAISGPAGARTFTLAQLKKLPVTEGLGGTKSSSGKVAPPIRYRGVALRDLVQATGGFDEKKNVTLTAKDGYSITFSYEQVTAGAFTAYDPGTGDTLMYHEPLTAIVAYAREGRPLAEADEGPLRVMIVGATNREVTDGHWNIKWLTQVAIEPVSRAWSLTLAGARLEVVNRTMFESGAGPSCHGVSWKDPDGHAWSGIPLWLLVGRVDDALKHGAGAFNDSLAAAGYTVDVIAADGGRVTLESARLRREPGIFIAHRLDQRPLPEGDFPLRLTGGNLRPDERLGKVTTILVHVPMRGGVVPPMPKH
jgi:DMSO/TMAO reductase YedYZ molybdopterin-dependent catalytic subunit